MYYNIERAGWNNASERGTLAFTDGMDDNQTTYPVFHSISIGFGVAEAQIVADIDGNKYLVLSGGYGSIYGLGCTEGYLCSNLGLTCSMPLPSELEQAIRGVCGGGEVLVIGGINISPICWRINLDGVSQIGTFYVGLEAGAGNGLSFAIPLSKIGIAPNPSLGWRWALDNQRNGTTYDKILAGGW